MSADATSGWVNDGTTQDQRFPAALDPASFKIDDRTVADFLRLIAAMADQLRLNQDQRWSALLPAIQVAGQPAEQDWQGFLAKVEGRRNNPPHLALLIAFLRLFRHAQDHLNELTAAHLDYYYQRVLCFRRHPAEPDRIVVFPALARGENEYRLAAGTELDAGEDEAGNALIYATDSEIVVTPARVASVLGVQFDSMGTTGGVWQRFPSKNDKGGFWRLVGDESDRPPDRQFATGFAISSPVLFMKEGERVISLQFDSLPVTAWSGDISAAGAWLPVVVTAEVGGLKIELSQDVPAIIAPDPKVHPGSPITPWPVLRLYPETLGIAAGKAPPPSRLTSIAVTVTGLASLRLSSDFGPINPALPFQPFGPQPEIGSTFTFQSDELEWKARDTSIAVNIVFAWLMLPADAQPAKYKYNCPASIASEAGFDLFAGESPKITAAAGQTIDRVKLTEPPGAFGHQSYPMRLSDWATKNAAKMIEYSSKPSGGTLILDPQPAPPYTPTLKAFSINYTATQAVGPQSREVAVRLFRWEPLGLAEQRPTEPLLPTELPSDACFIGLADAAPSERLNLHFAAIEGSGAPVPAGEAAPAIEWSYLAKAGWVTVGADKLSDDTGNLSRPGIVSLDLGPDAVNDNLRMPPGLHWLRATVGSGAESLAMISGIRAQAVGATLRLGEVPPVYLSEGSRAHLAPGSVKALLQPTPAIAAIEQPFTSFGGRAAEAGRGFYTRVSERLQHRNRAVTPWDYERLVLEKYPEIYKAVCVHPAPGKVTIVVVPRSMDAPWLNRLQPRARPNLREEIRKYLQTLSSAMASVIVTDPKYEEVKIDCQVVFKESRSPAFYRAQLNADLQRFLTPWAFDQSEEIVFGGRIHQSVIQAFIANLDYVEHFVGFQLSQDSEPCTEAKGTGATSVLVSASTHEITVPPAGTRQTT